MATGHEEHAHEHAFVDIVESDTITAFEQSPHGVITLQWFRRGVSLDLTYDDAVELGMVMEKVVEHVYGKGQTSPAQEQEHQQEKE